MTTGKELLEELRSKLTAAEARVRELEALFESVRECSDLFGHSRRGIKTLPSSKHRVRGKLRVRSAESEATRTLVFATESNQGRCTTRSSPARCPKKSAIRHAWLVAGEGESFFWPNAEVSDGADRKQ